MSTSINLQYIRPKEGDRRSAFEELSFQLFARQFESKVVVRRHGAGGDSGLEGVVIDSENRVVAGLQAKFFDGKLAGTQWKALDESIRTALSDNAADNQLKQIFVTLPRNLTQSQFGKWSTLCTAWQAEAIRLAYREPVTYTLWDESHLRGLLLNPDNRGLLLHYFELPDFDEAHCRRRTATTIQGLGDRYQPELHTTTAAEDKLHTFLRSERCRRQFIERSRDNLRSHHWLPMHSIPEELHAARATAEEA